MVDVRFKLDGIDDFIKTIDMAAKITFGHCLGNGVQGIWHLSYYADEATSGDIFGFARSSKT